MPLPSGSRRLDNSASGEEFGRNVALVRGHYGLATELGVTSLTQDALLIGAPKGLLSPELKLRPGKVELMKAVGLQSMVVFKGDSDLDNFGAGFASYR